MANTTTQIISSKGEHSLPMPPHVGPPPGHIQKHSEWAEKQLSEKK